MIMTGAGADQARREADVALRDGTTVHVRPARHEDAPELQRLFEGLSGESRYLRFFSGAVDVPLVVHWAADVDYQQRDGLVALTGADGRIVAHVGWERERDRPERAEIAEVMPGNHRMLRVFRDSGFSVRTRSLPGVIMAEMPTELTPDALRRFEDREERASAAAMRRVLAPRSVAVIGASRRRGTVGGELFHNLLAAGFAGPVYPVNPKATSVQSVAAYPTVDEVPGPVDLAVLAVPAAAVVPVARACAAKGVGALVVLSAGFAESGPEGVERQRDLLAVCRQAGMRLVGPNCLGVINTNPAVRLDATFGPTLPARGRVGFGSQSGALGLAIVDYANDLGLGLSSFVAMGNKADVSGNDLLGYWQDDPDTDMVLLYLESFGNPRKFAHFASRLARTKPIVAVKSGRSVAGARATSSHTGALLAASDVTVDALFRQAGVIRTDTLSELFDVAKLLATQPAPAGRRVAIVTNAGGPGILCADACEVAAAAQRAAANAPAAVTMQSVFMSSGDIPAQLHDGARSIPCYQFPEEAARALGRAADRGEWLRRPQGAVPTPPG